MQFDINAITSNFSNFDEIFQKIDNYVTNPTTNFFHENQSYSRELMKGHFDTQMSIFLFY